MIPTLKLRKPYPHEVIATVATMAHAAVYSGAPVTDCPFDIHDDPDLFEMFRDFYWKFQKMNGRMSNRLSLGSRVYLTK